MDTETAEAIAKLTDRVKVLETAFAEVSARLAQVASEADPARIMRRIEDAETRRRRSSGR